MKLKSILASVLTAACSFCVLTAQAATVNVNVSTLVGFESGKPIAIDGTLVMDQEFDLGTGTLILTGVSGITKGAVFTGSAGSVLDIELTGNASFNMTDSFLTGDLTFVKRGGGVLTLPKSSSHTGGTVLYGGQLIGNTSNTRTLNTVKPFGVAGSKVKVCGGILVSKGYNSWDGNYALILDGGCLQNTYDMGANLFNAPITVEGNSTIDVQANMNFSPSSVSGSGKLSITGIDTSTFVVKKDLSMNGISLAVSAPFDLGTYNLEVNDYEVTTETAPTGTGTITVNGAFKPTTENYCAVMLKDGAVIDLSAKAETWTPMGSVGFAKGATITIKVGERDLVADDYVLCWAAGMDYADRMFLISGDKTSELMLEADEIGLKVVAETDDVAYAVWTGAVDSNFMNSANWDCRNAADKVVKDGVPTEDTPVTFNDISKISFADALPFKTVTFDDAFLGADVIWNSLEHVPNDLVLDLKGKKLTLPKLTATTCAATITDSIGGGVVEMNVEEGFAFTNRTLNVIGKAKIEKTGAGTFVGILDLTNEGGFEVKEGKITPAAQGSLWVNNVLQTPFGKGVITIDENGLLDPLGGYNWGGVTIELNGGMITNTVQSRGLSGIGAINSSRQNPFNPTIVLSKDSTFVSATDFNFQGSIESNDHTLNLSIEYGMNFLWYPESATNLYLKVVKGGYFKTMRDPIDPAKTKGMTLDLNAAAKIMANGEDHPGGIDVENYISRYTANANSGAAPLRVHGVFRPETAYFYGATMMDGSTIDLTVTGARSTTSSSSSEGLKTLSFKSNATITLDVGDNPPNHGNKVISWTAAPENLDTLKFVYNAGAIKKGYMLEKGNDGVYSVKRMPFELQVRTDVELQEILKRYTGNQDLGFKLSGDMDNLKKILNGEADNEYTVAENIILGVEQEENGQFTKKPYLKADASAGVEEGKIKFAFGGLNEPKTDKADITYTIESAGTIDATNWEEATKGNLSGSDTTATATLPKPEAGQSAVKYYKVRFNVSEKAK